jgi:hypothetical protein
MAEPALRIFMFLDPENMEIWDDSALTLGETFSETS